jgi:hypothetical protein
MEFKQATVCSGEESFDVWYNMSNSSFKEIVKKYQDANLPCDVNVFCSFVACFTVIQSILLAPWEEYPYRYMTLSNEAYTHLKLFLDESIVKSIIKEEPTVRRKMDK